MNNVIERLELDLRECLAHLYDPTYEPTPLLYEVTGCDSRHGEPVRAAITQAIKALKPGPDIPQGARIARLYQVLSYRYLQKLTQEEAAERLSISPRHLRREQDAAIKMLAQYLWRQREEQALSPGMEGERDAGAAGWRSPVKAELAALQKSAPGSVANVDEAVRGVVELARDLAARHGVSLTASSESPDLTAAIHPTALRQILLGTITDLVANMSCGQIALSAQCNGPQGREYTAQVRGTGDRVEVDIRAEPMTIADCADGFFAQELLAAAGGSIVFGREGEATRCSLILPSARKVKVLVIDDNMDLVHFYRRYTARTRYEIEHLAGGEGVFEMVRAFNPQIIVLDVMLPDIDGWDLLTQLHAHADTRSIPVIICSVVQEEELAMALGAALYVAKPVRRRQFIQALDQALSRVAAIKPRARASNEGTD